MEQRTKEIILGQSFNLVINKYSIKYILENKNKVRSEILELAKFLVDIYKLIKWDQKEQ